jgi:hypothetical protein
MAWVGYVQDGRLFLTESKQGSRVHTRDHSRQDPTRMLVGTYRVWLDAWVRRGDVVYTSDPAFTSDAVDGEAGPWKAPALPATRYWQEIKILPPRRKGGVSQVRLRSRRFHWLYRLSRIVDVLEQLLVARETLTQKVDEVRALAVYMQQFRQLLRDSRSNTLRIDQDREQLKRWNGMGAVLANVKIHCDNFTHYSVCEASDSPLAATRHLNNVAHLLWQLTQDPELHRNLALYSPVLAEEHRIVLSRLGWLFNRVPRVFTSTTVKNRFEVQAEGESFAYGREFARQVTLPYFNEKVPLFSLPRPRTPDFKPGKTATALEIVSSCRRYGVSMLNAASIFVVKQHLHPEKLLDLVVKEQALWWNVSEGVALVELAQRYAKRFREAGRLEMLGLVDENLARRSGETAKARAELEAIRKEMEAKAETIVDNLKTKSPAAVYGLQMFEILVKWTVAVSAWTQYVEEREKTSSSTLPALVAPALKSADALGTTLRSLGLQNLLKLSPKSLAMWAKPLELTGKGLSGVADVGQAVVYSYDLFKADNNKGDELLSRYVPEDAVTAYAFHLVEWGGKWLVGLGSTAGVALKAPVLAKLQALGYLFQLTGEFGREFSLYGAAERKHFKDMSLRLALLAGIASQSVEAHGGKATFYDAADRSQMAGCIQEFGWLPVDPVLHDQRMNATG